MIKAALFGLGRIGASYDFRASKKGELPRSHLGALLENPAFEITALIDPDTKAFEPLKGKIPSNIVYTDLEGWQEDADLIIFANEPDNRIKDLKAILDKLPKVVVLEKPLALNFETAKEIEKLISDKNIASIINYHRRYDERYEALRVEVKSKIPEKIICRYAKGLLNYSSHHIDLVQDWFGDLMEIKLLSSHSENPDFCGKIKSGAMVYFLGIDNPEYDVFDMDVFFKDAHLRIENGGCEMSWRHPVGGLYYEGYAHLGQIEPCSGNTQVSGMRCLYRDIEEFISGKKDTLRGTSLAQGLKNMQITDMIKKQRIVK